MFNQSVIRAPMSTHGVSIHPWESTINMFGGLENLTSFCQLAPQDVEMIKLRIMKSSYRNPSPCHYLFMYVLFMVLLVTGIILSIVLLKKVWLIILLVILCLLLMIAVDRLVSEAYKSRLCVREQELKQMLHHSNFPVLQKNGVSISVGPFGSWLQVTANNPYANRGRPMHQFHQML